MAESISIKLAPEVITTANDSATNNNAVARIGQNIAFWRLLTVIFVMCFIAFFWVGGQGLRNLYDTPISRPDPISLKSVAKFQYSVYEVLKLPDSNTECSKKPNFDSLEFCVVAWGCPDTPQTPGGRCGFEPASVFYDGMSPSGDGVCQTQSKFTSNNNGSRIIGSSGAYSRSITTYNVTCVGKPSDCNFWKSRTIDFNITCLIRLPPGGDVRDCQIFVPNPKAWDKSQDGLGVCQLYWPTLRKVILQDIPSTSSITDVDYGGTFSISGPVKNNFGAWFNMCGFCSFSRDVKM